MRACVCVCFLHFDLKNKKIKGYERILFSIDKANQYAHSLLKFFLARNEQTIVLHKNNGKVEASMLCFCKSADSGFAVNDFLALPILEQNVDQRQSKRRLR